MAPIRNSLRVIAALALAVSAHAQNGQPPEQISFSAQGGFELSGNTYTIHRPRISGGDLSIAAETAVATSPELDGRWELMGSISMTVGTARLSAESAVFEFESGELLSGELAGEPATFEETDPQPGQPRPIRAEATRLVYDRDAGTVHMHGSTRFTYGQSRMSGCDFLYDLDRGLRSGSNECGEELSITYVPPGENGQESENGPASEEPDSGAAQDETPPAP